MLKRSGRSGMALFKSALKQIRAEQKNRAAEEKRHNGINDSRVAPVPEGAPPIKRSTGTLTKLEILCPQCEILTAHRIVRYEGDYGIVQCAKCKEEHRIPFKVRVST